METPTSSPTNEFAETAAAGNDSEHIDDRQIFIKRVDDNTVEFELNFSLSEERLKDLISATEELIQRALEQDESD